MTPWRFRPIRITAQTLDHGINFVINEPGFAQPSTITLFISPFVLTLWSQAASDAGVCCAGNDCVPPMWKPSPSSSPLPLVVHGRLGMVYQAKLILRTFNFVNPPQVTHVNTIKVNDFFAEALMVFHPINISLAICNITKGD